MTRVVVVGSGVAGLTVALDLAAHPGAEVTLVAKAGLHESSTRLAQGGVAAVTAQDDTVSSHIADTLAAGAGLCADDAVRVLCAGGPAAVATLIERGVLFDVRDGQLARGLEGAHSHQRILHAGGDATGAAIAAALIAQVSETAILVRERTTVIDVVVSDGRAVGVRLLGGDLLPADAVVLATGAAGQLFDRTTNPPVATGDGVAMAIRAGAIVADLEFHQFHPTALAAPGGQLVSEAVRGEGAVLVDADGGRFMIGVHPDAELAPRDVVARGIAEQMSRQGGAPVSLDATALGARFLAERFPTIDGAVRAQGLDWSRDPIPVAPAAHDLMGGVRTDLWGRTSIPGLFAVGAVACTGLHGANRLASNSLLEGAVFAHRVSQAVLGSPAQPPPDRFDQQHWAPPIALSLEHGGDPFDRPALQRLMWRAAGVSRDGDRLSEAADELASWAPPPVTDVSTAEDANLWLVARAVVASALARRESRGAHFRRDFPRPDRSSAVHSTLARLSHA